MTSQNSIIKTGIWYVEQFEKDNCFFMECLVTMSAVREIMIMVYNRLIVDNKILPIETLDEELKKELWINAHEFSKNRLPANEVKKLCKVLTVLKLL